MKKIIMFLVMIGLSLTCLYKIKKVINLRVKKRRELLHLEEEPDSKERGVVIELCKKRKKPKQNKPIQKGLKKERCSSAGDTS